MNKILIILTACFIFLLTDRAMADAGGFIGGRMNLDDQGSFIAVGYKYSNTVALEYSQQLESTVDYKSFKSGSLILTLPLKPMLNPYIKGSFNRFNGHDKSSVSIGNSFVILPNIVLMVEAMELGSEKIISSGVRLEF